MLEMIYETSSVIEGRCSMERVVGFWHKRRSRSMILEVRKVFKIKKRVVKRRGERSCWKQLFF